MKDILLILLLLFGVSCTKDEDDRPEGELLDKIVMRNMSTTSYRYSTKTCVYQQKRLVKIIADIDNQVIYEMRFSYDTLGKLIKTESPMGLQGHPGRMSMIIKIGSSK